MLNEWQTVVRELAIRQHQTLVAIVSFHVEGDLLLLNGVNLLEMFVPGLSLPPQIRLEGGLEDGRINGVFGVLIAVQDDRRFRRRLSIEAVGAGTAQEGHP